MGRRKKIVDQSPQLQNVSFLNDAKPKATNWIYTVKRTTHPSVVTFTLVRKDVAEYFKNPELSNKLKLSIEEVDKPDDFSSLTLEAFRVAKTPYKLVTLLSQDNLSPLKPLMGGLKAFSLMLTDQNVVTVYTLACSDGTYEAQVTINLQEFKKA